MCCLSGGRLPYRSDRRHVLWGCIVLRLRPFGDSAVLAEVESLADVLDLHARLAASRPAGVVDLVPAARTVLVHVDPTVLPLSAVRGWIAGHDLAAAPTAPDPARRAAREARVRPGDPASPIELPIVYDGADLAAAAALLGIGAGELVARHAAAEWTVAFTGFAPGFGYLVSPDWRFDVPRRATPRTRVPAGAVGLAGGFSGAYPRDTPGGWQIIGTTPAALFSPAAAAPALLAPGTRVRFRPSPHARLQPRTETAATSRSLGAPVLSRDTALAVIEPGLLATVQDQGRAGHAAEGIAPAGAADRAALRTANRLVGNAEDAAGIEVTLGGFRAVAETDLWCAVTGGWGPVRIAGHEVDPYTAHAWPAGAELQLDWFTRGARGYLAVRGGIDAPLAVGSRATDTLAGLGPAPLRAGDRLARAADTQGAIPAEDLHPWSPPDDELIEVELTPGPRADWFTAAALPTLFESVWTVSNDADRVGIRLDGPELVRTRTGELPSEGMLPGALQVPPRGRPVILGPDGPVTGGYPVIAVATDAARDALAQARPGTRLRFRHAR